MSFAFPNIKASCPICSEPGCAVWKGYYQRRMWCAILEVNEMVAIHAGHCRSKKKDFSFLPDILIPYRQVTKSSLSSFFDHYLRLGSLQAASEQFTAHLGDDWYIPISSSWEWLKLLLIFCRLNFEILDLPDSANFLDLSSLRVFSTSEEVPIFDLTASWPRSFKSVSKPP